MTRVSIDDLEYAASWLECHESEGRGSEACHKVAKWLLDEVEHRIQEAAARKLSKMAGVPVKRARQAIQNKQIL